jgi:8-oxo-dGTP pyrophosphatase MutT (NUDIX family)
MLNTKLLAVEPMRQFFNKAFARAGALKDHKQFDVQWQKKFGKIPPHQTDLGGLTPKQHKEYSQKYVEHVSHITTGGDPDELWYGKDTSTPVKKVESVTRVGDDHGFKDHTDHEAYIMDMAKMKGLQYGNSVTDKERAHHLSHLANSFKDLASILNVPDKMISMNGRLSVAVGARGTKGAMAHYAPNLRVINLTRAKGSGTLAHEWAHAFDDHIGRMTNNIDNFAGFASFGHGNHDLNKHFNNLKQALGEFQDRVYEEHSTKPSKERQSKIHYWTKNEELFARAFEGYVHTKLSKSGKENNYLINHQTHKDNHYLWPNQQERDKHEKLFDDLFSAFRNSDLLHKSMKIFDPSYVYDAKHFELLNKSDSADQPIMQVSSVAVIYHNHLLMGKRRDTQKWTFPGGKVNRGESPDAAAYREVFEEAGIDARHHQLHILGSGDVISAEGNPIKVHSYALFEYFPTDSSKDPDKEVDEWAWIDISKGLPDHIKNNLHNPKNVTLNLLGLMSW